MIRFLKRRMSVVKAVQEIARFNNGYESAVNEVIRNATYVMIPEYRACKTEKQVNNCYYNYLRKLTLLYV